MLIGPRRESARAVHDAEDTVCADEFPREYGLATLAGIANQFVGIDGVDSAVGQGCARSSAIYLGLIDIDSFLVLGSRSGWGRVGSAGASSQAIAGGGCGRIIIARIRHIVINARKRRTAAGDDRGQAGKGIGGFGSARGDVIDAALAEGEKIRAV